MTDISSNGTSLSHRHDTQAPLSAGAELTFEDHQYYRDLLQSLPAAVYTCNNRGEITLYNRAAVELWGREPKLRELWCGSFRIFYLDGKPMQLDTCPMAICLKERRSVRGVEIIVERPDGQRRNVLPFPTPLYNAAGEVIGAMNMLVDITENKRVQQALSENEQKYHRLLDLLPVAVCSMEAPSGRIQYYNHVAMKIWGRKPVPGDPLECYGGAYRVYTVDGRLLERSQFPMIGVLAGGPPVRNYEVILERPDGTRITVAANIDAIHNTAGAVIGAVNVFYDVSARKEAENQLKIAKALAEEASQAKDRFLAVLSHELRTPLTPVLMAAATMEENADLPADVREDIAMIRRNVELETKLIDDLLDLNRVASNKLRLQPRPVNLNEIVRNVCGICRSQVLEKGIHLHCELDDSVGVVTADPARLQQVLWNILKNAAKFTPDGGEIFVRTQNQGSTIRMTVRDTGRGIEPELLHKVFEAFEQGSAAITQRFGGMGLGLAISKALVELHGGTIRAESTGVGNGATFIVEIPARSIPVESVKQNPKIPQAPRPTHLSLLIVEDHADTAKLLGRVLTGLGYSARTATTAEHAMAQLETQAFDVLISDIGLPDMTGHELMRRALDRHSAIRGIAMSGFGMDDDIRRSQAAGFAEHLTKPVSIDHLEDAIRRLANQPTSGSM